MKTQLFSLLLLWITAVSYAQPLSKGGRVNQTATVSSGTTWAVVVGISGYQYVDKLNYADKDAEAFYQYLLSPAGGSVPQSNITLLTNEKATTAQIDKALANLTSLVKPGDRVVLYFSGHGDQETSTIAQRGFLLTYDTFATNYMAGAFAILFFQDYINTLSTRNGATVQVFLDACRAGKLAGNEAGGVQLTGEQLAKQAANETKLLACQSNEVSLEGPQWGGGRGAFSYHLVRGLQGLADVNPADGQVTVRELERYLEDHVSPEVAPVKQTPFKVGDANVVLARVDAPTLAALKNNQPLPTFAAISGKGFVETALDKADAQTVALYRQFQAKLASNQPEFAIVDYEQLAGKPQLAPALPFLKHDLAAALMDEGQEFLNRYLKSEMKYEISKAAQNRQIRRQIRQFTYAATLLGPASSFYKPALARAAFFKGLDADLEIDTLAALTANQQALKLDSTAAFAYNYQGAVLSVLKRFQEAETSYRTGIRFAPNWNYLYYNLGLVLTDQKRPEEAEAAYRKAIQLKPDYANAYLNLGNLLTAQKRPDEAEAVYRKAIQLKPDEANVYNSLGILLADQKRPEEAEAAYRKAIQLKPDYANAYLNLGNLLADQKRPDEAEAAYRIAILLKPDDANIYNSLGILLATQKRPEEAEAAYRKAIQLKPDDATAYNNLGILLDDQKRPDEAEAAYRKAIQLKPDYANAYHSLGILLGAQNRFVEAEAAYRKAIQLKPDYANAYNSLGSLLAQQGRYLEAMQFIQPYVKLQPDQADGWGLLGTVFMSLKQYPDAKTYLERSLTLNPNSVGTPYNLACLYSLQNQTAPALEWLEKALQNGFADFAHIAEDSDLDNIRQTDGFNALLAKYKK